MDEQDDYSEYDPNSTVLGNYGADDTPAMKWQLDPKDVIDEIERQLRGLELRNHKLVRFRTPLMNDLGIGSIKILLRAHLHTSNALTEVKKEEAYNVTAGVAELINDQLYVNGEKWQVDDADKTLINTVVENSVFLFLLRPVDGKERDRWTKTYKISDTPQRRQGMISGIFNTGGHNYDGYS